MSYFLYFFSILLLPFLSMSELSEEDPQKGQFKIMDGSKLFFNGNSNINRFKCFCESSFPRFEFIVQSPKGESDWMEFHQTTLEIPVDKLDCGHKVMNKDLKNALKADQFPLISIALDKVEWESDCDLKDLNKGNWLELKATTSITIAGNTQIVPIAFKIQQFFDDQCCFHLQASKSMRMSDFGITPPTALMGMIKVKNELNINLDLRIEVLH